MNKRRAERTQRHARPRFCEADRTNLKMRSGVAGNVSISIPSGDRASEIAFAIAAGAPIVPPSPMPRNPPLISKLLPSPSLCPLIS